MSRALSLPDLPAVFENNRVNGLTGLALEDWLAWARWAVCDNPYRGEAPIGFGVEVSGVLRASVLSVHVPCRIGEWRGIAAMPYALVAGGVPLAGIRLMRDYTSRPGLLSHANRFGAELLGRGSGRPVSGSDISVTLCLSRPRRILRALRRPLPARPGPRRPSMLPRKGKTGTVEYEEIALDHLPEEPVDALARVHLSMFDVAIAKDCQYLRWRYGCEGARRWAVAQWQGDDLDGLAILEETPERDCRVMEFLRRPDTGCDERLIAALVDSASRRRLIMLYGRAGDPALADLWGKAGAALNVRPYPQFWVIAGGLALPSPMHGSYSHGEHGFV